MINVWHEDGVLDELLRRQKQGLSASQIATRINDQFFKGVKHVTRNSVIGKLVRLGMTVGQRGSTMAGQPRRRSKKRKTGWVADQVKMLHVEARTTVWTNNRPILPTDPSFVANPLADRDIPLSQRKSLIELEDNHCRWPIGDPQNTDFAFCGGDKISGLSYCKDHIARAFAPPQPRRKPAGGAVAPKREKVPTFEDA